MLLNTVCTVYFFEDAKASWHHCNMDKKSNFNKKKIRRGKILSIFQRKMFRVLLMTLLNLYFVI